MGKHIVRMACYVWLLLAACIVLAGCGNRFEHEHELVYHEATEVSCTTEGVREHWECSVCGGLFRDAGARRALDEEDVFFEPLGHDMTAWSANGATHVSTCRRCGESVGEAHQMVATEGSHVGHLADSVCEVCGYTEDTILPLISITTNDGSEIVGNRTEASYVACTVTVSGCAEGDALTDIAAQVKVRGNYSADYDKKPYRIKFDKKQGMLGLNNGAKAKNWVLLAEYKDRSMLRNATALYLADALFGGAYYSADYRFVEVEVNGTYRGLYLLTEQQQVNEHRVDIAEPADDYTGTDIGYLVELDGYYAEEAALEQFVVNYGYDLRFADGSTAERSRFEAGYTIKSDVYAEEQRVFIRDYIQNAFRVVCDALYGNHDDLTANPYQTLTKSGTVMPDPTISSAREAVEKLIDVPSLINMYLLQEICMDMDIGWSSFFISVDVSATGNGKLTFEAPWDFDSALGYSVTENQTLYALTRYTGSSAAWSARNYTNPWLLLLANEGWYRRAVDQRWRALKNDGVLNEALRRIDVFTETFAAAFERNFAYWNECLTYTEVSTSSAYDACRTQAAASAYLKAWLSERFLYLGQIFSNMS